MFKNIKYWWGFCILFATQPLFAQRPEVEMADIMRSNGKIYVVVAIVAVIFIGIVMYLVSIDRKLRKLEKKIEK